MVSLRLGQKQEQGYVTATVILVMLISVVGGAYLLKRVKSQAAASGGYYQARSAALAAQAGLESGLSQLETDPIGSLALLNAFTSDPAKQWLLGSAANADSRHLVTMDNHLQRYAARIVAFDKNSGTIKIEGQGEGPGGSSSKVYGIYRLGGLTTVSPALAKYVWFMAGESRNVDQQVEVRGDAYFGGGVHFNGGAANSILHGTVKIARGTGLQSSFDEKVTFCKNTYVQTPFKAQGVPADICANIGFEEELFIDSDPLLSRTGQTAYFNKSISGGHAKIDISGNNVVHAGSLDLSRIGAAGSVVNNGGPIDIASRLGMLPGPESELTVDKLQVPAGKRHNFATMGIGSWGNVTATDLNAAYLSAKAMGRLYKDFLVLEVNNQINIVPSGGVTLKGKFYFEVGNQINININLPTSDPSSISIYHVCTGGRMMGFGGSGLFRGYINVSGTGSVVYQWNAGAEFKGAIHHVSPTTGFQLNGSTGPLRLTFDPTVFSELSALGILVAPGSSGSASGTLTLVDKKIRPQMRSRYF